MCCRYQYVVRATNTAGSSDGPVISVTTDEAVPSSLSAPTVTPVTGRHDQLLITWSAPLQPNGIILNYIIQRNESTPWNVQVSLEEEPLEYLDDSLLPDTIYSYTVSACTSAGCTTSVRTTARTNEDVPAYMSPPEAVALNASAVRVTWTTPSQPNGRIARYELLVNGTSTYDGLSTIQVVADLQPYVLYQFVIKACTSVGCTSSQPTLARPTEAPPTDMPAPTVRVTGTRSTEISWSPPTRPNGLILGYELRRNDSVIQLTSDTWYVDYDCLPATTYGYQVNAYNSEGDVGSPITFATTFSSAPEGVQQPRLTVLSSTLVAVTWQVPAVPNGQIVNYTLYVEDEVVYTGLSTSTVVRDLSPWTSYGFRVSACTQNGCTRSREARATTLEAAPGGVSPPRLTAPVVGQVVVEWTAPSSPNGVISRYELYRRDGNLTDSQGLVSVENIIVVYCVVS